ncbi:MAG: hypothetical protein K0R57_6545 [Paenibacillaceae bacterium]|jgi:ABC-type polysaccharide transport system permease subunit|nr:hypothetical protein [Paenibacillaceae bacterium]
MSKLQQSLEIEAAVAPHVKRKDGTGLWQRIWRYKFHYILVLPALLFIMFFKIIPFLMGAWISLIEYNLFEGVLDSPLVGWANFGALFENPAFRAALSNTLLLKFLYLAFCGILAMLLALAVSSIRSRPLKYIFTTLILLPYFIPSVAAAYMLNQLWSPEHLALWGMADSPLDDAFWFPIIVAAAEAVKTCGIPVLLAVAAIHVARNSAFPGSAGGAGISNGRAFLHGHLYPAARAIGAFLLLQLSSILANDFELVFHLRTAANQAFSDTLDTFIYTEGFKFMFFSSAAAAGLLQFAVQLLFTVLAYLLVRGLFRDALFPGAAYETVRAASDIKGHNIAGLLICSVYSLAVLLVLYGLLIDPFTTETLSGTSVGDIVTPLSLLFYGAAYLAAAIVSQLIALALAYPLTAANLPGRGLYKWLLVIVVLLGTRIIPISEYLLAGTGGLINTFFPILLNGLFSVISAFVLKSIFNSRYMPLREQAAAAGRGEMYIFFCLFIPKLWKHLIAMAILQFVTLWNSSEIAILYLNDPELAPPVMLFRMAAWSQALKGMEMSGPVIGQTAALVSVVPIVLLLLFRPLLTAETMVNEVRRL